MKSTWKVAWEENFNITSIQPEKVEVGGKIWIKICKVYECLVFSRSIQGTI